MTALLLCGFMVFVLLFGQPHKKSYVLYYDADFEPLYESDETTQQAPGPSDSSHEDTDSVADPDSTEVPSTSESQASAGSEDTEEARRRALEIYNSIDI